jgi:hypothetical protein
MSNNGTSLEGVVNHRGQVFAGNGNEVSKVIICVDGSIIPTSLSKLVRWRFILFRDTADNRERRCKYMCYDHCTSRKVLQAHPPRAWLDSGRKSQWHT